MLSFRMRWQYGLAAVVIAIFLSLGSDKAADLNPTAVIVKLPADIQWTRRYKLILGRGHSPAPFDSAPIIAIRNVSKLQFSCSEPLSHDQA
jgi:hypothetical protein